MLKLQYTITKNDYINYYSFMYWDEGTRRKKRLLNMAKQIGVLAIFFAILYFTNVLRNISNTSLIFFVIIFGSSALPLFTGRLQIKKQAEVIADNEENESIFKEMMLEISDAGIYTKNEYVETNYKWISVIKKQESDDYYFLFQNAMQALIIPKRAFNNTNEKMIFDKLLSKNLSLQAEINLTDN